MTEGERVKAVRKARGLTLEKFGERFGMSRSSISDIENGRRSLTPQTRISICREFNVDEDWLRNGENEEPVFVKPEKFSLDEFVKAHGGADGLELQIIKSYFELPKETRRMLVQHFQKGLAAASEAEQKSMRERAADLYDEQNKAEEKPDAPASSANESAVG